MDEKKLDNLRKRLDKVEAGLDQKKKEISGQVSEILGIDGITEPEVILSEAKNPPSGDLCPAKKHIGSISWRVVQACFTPG
jgi:hypothetical protein